MNTENHALDQAKAQAESITQMVAALEVDYSRLEELQEERAGHTVENEAGEDTPMPSFWAQTYPDEAEELEELVGNAGDCESEDDARERIQEHPLSVEVRSGWASNKEEFEAEEFQILLCTGGPAVRITGELYNGDPTRAWIEYQDWKTPWSHAYGVIDSETLLTYCRQFYFGD